jgi:hypothetical protein
MRCTSHKLCHFLRSSANRAPILTFDEQIRQWGYAVMST